MKSEATSRAQMPKGTHVLLESRSLENSYPTLIPILKKGIRVLDVGCGTGSITAGIAKMVGPQGKVIGIDSSDHLIVRGKENYLTLKNLDFIETDLFKYFPDEKFDLVISSRVLQWLNNPREALVKCKELLVPHGQISILDYNHLGLEWKPEPPESMKRFYQAFLDWRSDAGMDNEITNHLPDYFSQLGFLSIEKLNADEVYQKGEKFFMNKIGIWSTVAESRGVQMVKNGYISENERIKTIEEYNSWIREKAEWMSMKLDDIRAKMNG
ncbi:MAG: class I SAM-dependent methyltransferase [Chitinophagaceae bacterium]